MVQSLKDPQLTALIDRAIANNLEVKRAAARLLEVKAERRITKSALLPSINQTDSVQRIRGGYANGNIHVGTPAENGGSVFVAPFETTLFQVGFDASWEIDLFGGRRHELEAATADVEATREAQHDVLISVLG